MHKVYINNFEGLRCLACSWYTEPMQPAQITALGDLHLFSTSNEKAVSYCLNGGWIF